jgi:hypothetical protein
MVDSSPPEKLSYEAEVAVHAWGAQVESARSHGVEILEVGLIGRWPDTALRILWVRPGGPARESSVRLWSVDGSTDRPAYGVAGDLIGSIYGRAVE